LSLFQIANDGTRLTQYLAIVGLQGRNKSVWVDLAIGIAVMLLPEQVYGYVLKGDFLEVQGNPYTVGC
jgi:hypothetical protein